MDQQELLTHIEDFFDTLYITEGATPDDEIMSLIHLKITPIEARVLQAQVTEEEIYHATFALHPTKCPEPNGFTAQFYH
ncbi:hypothetical protein Scep_012754 [Stephania cephalantha]|uniref:Uncharacterized protein n=1 Tax=Stephania cephalantha TaxID=152367 RepID=A0AAP0PA53_9MAGN